jgi:hypothetical protein
VTVKDQKAMRVLKVLNAKSRREIPLARPAIVRALAPHDSLIRPKRILVPIDFSSESRKAFRYAIEIARLRDASITLMHVTEPIVSTVNAGYGPITRQIPNNKEIQKANTKLVRLAEGEGNWSRRRR